LLKETFKITDENKTKLQMKKKEMPMLKLPIKPIKEDAGNIPFYLFIKEAN
jgi:hypothetical protein